MALSEIEIKRIEKSVTTYVEARRPPPHIRPTLDLGWRLSGQSVELQEIRPDWKRPEIVHHRSFAKATFVRTQGVWKIYWMRADLRRHAYEPDAEVRTIDDFLKVVERDEYGCFRG